MKEETKEEPKADAEMAPAETEQPAPVQSQPADPAVADQEEEKAVENDDDEE